MRLIHAFCEAAPMLLLQLYLLSIGINDNLGIENEKIKSGEVKDSEKLTKLTAVSAGLSLWSVCWAVASFSKGAARLRNLERLVLTWLGVLAQLFWRLGTVSARVGALVVYASLYGGQWLLIVMALHWLSMLTWLLLTPDGLFHVGERLPLMRKSILASMLAFVYIFAYVNLHETNHRQKMVSGSIQLYCTISTCFLSKEIKSIYLQKNIYIGNILYRNVIGKQFTYWSMGCRHK